MLNEFAKAEYVSDESLDLDEMLRHTSHSHVLIIINISYTVLLTKKHVRIMFIAITIIYNNNYALTSSNKAICIFLFSFFSPSFTVHS